MAKIFVSHAHEDKAAIARPLARALKKKHEVWFDEFELRVGDSLRERIDQGLQQCDFGVVILSKAFFGKKWTQAELDGLLALESKNRKLILPVWFGVTEPEVKKFSPMLAGRVGARTENGIEAVVDELTRSIDSSQRTMEVTAPQRSRSALSHLKQTLDAAEYEQEYLNCREGVAGVTASASTIVDLIAGALRDAERNSARPRFYIEHANEDKLTVNAPYDLRLQTGLRKIFKNTAAQANLTVRVTKMDRNNRFAEGRMCWEEQWRPRCKRDAPVVWADRNGSITFRDDEIADQIVERLTSWVHSEKHVADQEQEKNRYRE